MDKRRHNPYFRRLLVGFDGSSHAEKAVDVAMELAECIDADVLVFAVARLPEPATIVEVDAVLDEAREHYNVAFRKLIAKAKNRELNVKTELAVGHPAEQIIRRAEAGGFDLVLLGHRGTSMFEKIVMGSISERVLKYAHCPVMIVR
jgi:nucleotide-binding universal stress UspA family protein